MIRRHVPLVGAGAVALAAALAPMAFAAASKPAVSTGAVANAAPTGATLLGSVRPGGAQTTYGFQYGPTSKYGARSATRSAGDSGAVPVAIDIAGLTPNTVYHYRLIARNAKGTTTGSDRAFRTKPQPLGLSLSVAPNPVTIGGTITLSGALSGTGTKGRRVVVQANAFPFTTGFAPAGNPQIVDASGAFALTLPALALNTQFRAVVPGTEVASPVVTATAAVKVSAKPSRRRVRRGSRVTFRGAIRPLRPGVRVAIQKLNSKQAWVTVAGTRAVRGGDQFSIFRKRVRIRRGGQYRAFVEVTDGSVVSSSSPPVKLTSFRRR